MPTTEWEDVTSSYNPDLNIFGLISLDPDIESFVSVNRTLNLTEASEIFVGESLLTYTDYFGNEATYTDSLFEDASLVKTAFVSITDGENSYNFEYNDEDYNYKNVDGTFIPAPDTEYSLIITTSEYGDATGTLVTPSMPRFDRDAIDTLYIEGYVPANTEPYWLAWDSIDNWGYLSGSAIIDWEYYNSLIEDSDEEYLRYSDILCENDLPCCRNMWRFNVREELNLNSDGWWIPAVSCGKKGTTVLLYRLTSMDQNYYDYFVQEEGKDFTNFLLDSSGEDGRAIGIEGALGIFGAIASDTLYLPIEVIDND